MYCPLASCENQDPPDLRTTIGPAPATAPAPTDAGAAASGTAGEIVDRSQEILGQMDDYRKALEAADADSGDDAIPAAAKPAEKTLSKSLKQFYADFGGK